MKHLLYTLTGILLISLGNREASEGWAIAMYLVGGLLLGCVAYNADHPKLAKERRDE